MTNQEVIAKVEKLLPKYFEDILEKVWILGNIEDTSCSIRFNVKSRKKLDWSHMQRIEEAVGLAGFWRFNGKWYDESMNQYIIQLMSSQDEYTCATWDKNFPGFSKPVDTFRGERGCNFSK